MITQQTAEMLAKIKKGTFEPGDTALLDQMPADELVAELRSGRYGLTFQERHIGKKWEVSLARTLRAELIQRRIPEAVFVSLQLVPAYIECVMINSENNRVTGISRTSRLTVWLVTKPELGLALRSGSGYKLDRTPDGWEMKPMKKRTVKLPAGLLRSRGWRFEHLQQFVPVA
jgi:hypothetical protein